MPGQSFMSMDQVFENQIMGMMQLARMMEAAAGMSDAMNDFSNEEYPMRRNPYHDDAGPVPMHRQESTDPTFVAPHTYNFETGLIFFRNRGETTQRPVSSKGTRHRYSDYENKTNEFCFVCYTITLIVWIKDL